MAYKATALTTELHPNILFFSMYLLYIIYWLLSRANLKKFLKYWWWDSNSHAQRTTDFESAAFTISPHQHIFLNYIIHINNCQHFFLNCRRNDYHQFVATPQTLLCVEHIYNIAHIFHFVKRFFIFYIFVYFIQFSSLFSSYFCVNCQ